MDKYISQQYALSTYCTDCCVDCGDSMCADWNKIRKWISDIPTADVAPVVHGKWKEESPDYLDGDTIYICSVCGETWNLEAGTPKENNMNYCPNCGAKMDL